MSFNGSGTFLINSSGQPVVANTLITASVMNALTADLATGLSNCITKDGQTTITANIPMATNVLTGLGAGSANGQSLRYEQLFSTSAVTLLGAMNWVKGADIASASTINLTTATGNAVHVTGTTAITAVTLGSGMWRLVIFDGALTLTHHATNNNLPSGANITTAANDRALYWADGTTVYCVAYQKASGKAVVETVSSADSNVLTWLATPSSANLAAAVTGETGTGALVFAESPTLVTPALGTPASGVLTNCTEKGPNLGTEASSGGTATGFTGIPTGCKRISINFYGWSASGTSPWIVQIGDSGGYENTGYASACTNTSGSPTTSSAGFLIHESPTAAYAYGGRLVLERVDSDGLKWVATGILFDLSGGGTEGRFSSGIKALSARLDRIQWTTSGGSDTSDAGSINIQYDQ